MRIAKNWANKGNGYKAMHEKTKSCISCKKLLLPFSRPTPETLTVRCLDKDGKERFKEFPFGDSDTGVICCDEFEDKESTKASDGG